MAKLIDLTGRKFGRLTVVRRSLTMQRDKEVVLECICSCGNKCYVRGGSLRKGETHSCGFFVSEVSRERLANYWKNRRNNPPMLLSE